MNDNEFVPFTQFCDIAQGNVTSYFSHYLSFPCMKVYVQYFLVFRVFKVCFRILLTDVTSRVFIHSVQQMRV